MKLAKIVTKNGMMTPNGRERVMMLKAGKNGTGEQIGNSVSYWPWSDKSCEQADRIISEIAERHGYKIVPDYE